MTSIPDISGKKLIALTAEEHDVAKNTGCDVCDVCVRVYPASDILWPEMELPDHVNDLVLIELNKHYEKVCEHCLRKARDIASKQINLAHKEFNDVQIYDTE
jgi:ferredoxin